jgi:motility quorum-sensing regulator/GCU-specific mRNA interferase toxin
MFYKSMTCFGNHKIWQDVYHVPARGLVLYVKFQEDLLTEFSVVSIQGKVRCLWKEFAGYDC